MQSHSLTSLSQGEVQEEEKEISPNRRKLTAKNVKGQVNPVQHPSSERMETGNLTDEQTKFLINNTIQSVRSQHLVPN